MVVQFSPSPSQLMTPARPINTSRLSKGVNVKPDSQNDNTLDERGPETRRGFLRKALSLAAAATMTRPSLLLGQEETASPTSMPATPAGWSSSSTLPGPSTQPSLAKQPSPTSQPSSSTQPVAAISRVAYVTSERVLPVRIVQQPLLKDLIREGLMLYTEQGTVEDAWHKILKPDDVVLFKFNQSGASRLGTSQAMAEALVTSLIAAGWNPNQIMLLETEGSLSFAGKTKQPDRRWQGQVVEFGKSGKDTFVAALDQATAIINVPFLKTHHLATMTSCLKNLSHGLIRHPARFHGNGCDPAIGEIVASKQIRSKLRLNVVNALRVVFDRGAEAGEREVATVGSLLFGIDPVACDAVGYGILNAARSSRKLKPLLPSAQVPRQLNTAAALGLGQFDAERIDLRTISG